MKNLFLLSCFCIAISFSQSSKMKEEIKTSGPVTLVKEKEKKEVKDGEMKIYYLVLLKKGPNRTQDSATAAEIQKGHMANIKRLYEAGKIDLAGPMESDGDLRGIFVFNCDSYEEVLSLCASDPAIGSGRLQAEIHPWYSQKGAKLR